LSSVFKGGWPDIPSLLSSVDLRKFFAGDFGEVTVGELAGDIRHEDSLHLGLRFFTPWKINMELTNCPSLEENYLPNLHDYVPS